MRVTQDSLVQSTLNRLQTRLNEHQDASTKVSTGKAWQVPSDDPARANQSLVLRADEHARTQQQRNAQDAESRLEITDSTLQSMNDRLHRARDLAVQAAKGTNDESERTAIADEIDEIREELKSLANTRHAGKALFAGYTDGPAVAFSPEDPEDDDELEVAFKGDDGHQIDRKIGPNETVRSNVTAAEVFAADLDDLDDGELNAENTFSMLHDLAVDVRAGDVDKVSDAIGDIDDAQDRLQSAQSSVGVAHSRVLSALDRSERDLLAVQKERSDVEDVNLAEAIMELQTQEVAFESTLGSMARVLQPSLMDFIR